MRADSAINAYKKAIDTLPSSSPTPSQQKQKKQYEDCLHEAEKLNRPKKADVVRVSKDHFQETPLGRVSCIRKEMGMYPMNSSVSSCNSQWCPILT